MSYSERSFAQRVNSIEKKNRRFSDGYRLEVSDTGLIVQRSVRKRRFMPWRSLLMIVVGFMLFKALILTNLGAQEYDRRLAGLASGTGFEAMGASIMKRDPVTEWISGAFGQISK